MVGHYPIGGCLRVACSFLKRHCSQEKSDGSLPDVVIKHASDVEKMVEKKDECGKWLIKSKDECFVWCDASSIALGAAVENE